LASAARVFGGRKSIFYPFRGLKTGYLPPRAGVIPILKPAEIPGNPGKSGGSATFANRELPLGAPKSDPPPSGGAVPVGPPGPAIFLADFCQIFGEKSTVLPLRVEPLSYARERKIRRNYPLARTTHLIRSPPKRGEMTGIRPTKSGNPRNLAPRRPRAGQKVDRAGTVVTA
jgi:hypothetical protein